MKRIFGILLLFVSLCGYAQNPVTAKEGGFNGYALRIVYDSPPTTYVDYTIDEDGLLTIDGTGDSVAIVFDIDSVSFTGTGGIVIHRGTTAQRLNPVNGMIRYNTTTNSFEGYKNGEWENFTLNFTASSVDNAVPRFDGTGGDLLQESLVTIDDFGNISSGSTSNTTSSLAIRTSNTGIGTLAFSSPSAGSSSIFSSATSDELTLNNPNGQINALCTDFVVSGNIVTQSIMGGLTDGILHQSGGSSEDLGSNVILHSESHSTDADDIIFRASTDTILRWDDSQNDWTFTEDVNFTEKSSIGSGSELTISSGSITITGNYHIIDTEGNASTDDLTQILGGITGQILILRSVDATRDVSILDNTNLRISGGFTLDNLFDSITLMYTGTSWFEISRSDNQ